MTVTDPTVCSSKTGNDRLTAPTVCSGKPEMTDLLIRQCVPVKPEVEVQEVTERFTGPTVSSGKAGRAGTGSDRKTYWSDSEFR